MPTYRNNIVVPTSKFSYKDNVFVCEMSDLQWRFVPVYLNLQSVKTGKIELFQLISTIRDNDGDVIKWVYGGMEVRDIQIHIFND